jgi:hypothetical protein
VACPAQVRVEALAIGGRVAREGFLWSPRLYGPLLLAFKPQFLDTARHYGELGKHAQQFGAFLTYAALGPVDGYTAEEWRAALAALPQEGLQESAQALAQALEGAADQREEYWKSRIQPFWQDVWPKSRDLATPGITESLARLCIAAGSEFPAALTAVLDWLRPIEHPYYVIHRLHESGLCGRFPTHALQLLTAIFSDKPWGTPELGQCLDLIVQSDASLAQHASYQRLREYARMRGGWTPSYGRAKGGYLTRWAMSPTVISPLAGNALGHGWARLGPQMGHKAKRRPLGRRIFSSKLLFLLDILWLRGQDLNLRPLGYEPNELPGCSTPRLEGEL